MNSHISTHELIEVNIQWLAGFLFKLARLLSFFINFIFLSTLGNNQTVNSSVRDSIANKNVNNRPEPEYTV